jgi:hypothetical protein
MAASFPPRPWPDAGAVHRICEPHPLHHSWACHPRAEDDSGGASRARLAQLHRADPPDAIGEGAEGAEVCLSLDSRDVRAVTDKEGYFEFDVALERNLDGDAELDVKLLSPRRPHAPPIVSTGDDMRAA